MARSRAFLPPATCSRCNARPELGETLFHTGSAWICAGCLTEEVPGTDVITKAVSRSIQAERHRALSRRGKAAGHIEDAAACENHAKWHEQALDTLLDNGERQVRNTPIVNGEALPSKPGYLKDTLADPALVAIESSYARGRMLLANDVVALGIDVGNTAGASNTHEKIIAHEIALAHKVAMEQANAALHESDPAIEIKRLQVVARMMTMAQQGVLTLQKLKGAGAQKIVVQHVHVEAGGQAVVGNVQTGHHEEE